MKAMGLVGLPKARLRGGSLSTQLAVSYSHQQDCVFELKYNTVWNFKMGRPVASYKDPLTLANKSL